MWTGFDSRYEKEQLQFIEIKQNIIPLEDSIRQFEQLTDRKIIKIVAPYQSLNEKMNLILG
jgi:hypothetical protein